MFVRSGDTNRSSSRSSDVIVSPLIRAGRAALQYQPLSWPAALRISKILVGVVELVEVVAGLEGHVSKIERWPLPARQDERVARRLAQQLARVGHDRTFAGLEQLDGDCLHTVEF